MAEITIHTIRGKASFAKVLPDQLSLNYNKDGKEWKIDLEIDEATVKELKKLKIGDKIRRGEPYEKDGVEKPAYLDGRPYLTFRQAELKRDGSPNNPIDIKDILGKPWDYTKEIGNGSVIDLKFAIVDNGVGKKKGMYPRAIRVLEHVPYERKTFTDLDPADPYYQAALEAQKAAKATVVDEAAEFRKDFGLDDLDDDIDDVM
jgi:hypothetical protein